MGRACTVHFLFLFFYYFAGREGGKEVVFSLIRILISQESLGGLIQNINGNDNKHLING